MFEAFPDLSKLPDGTLIQPGVAAKALDVSYDTVVRYMNRGLLARVKIGPRMLRTTVGSVRQIMQQSGVGAA
jgi:hypothetical protein